MAGKGDAVGGGGGSWRLGQSQEEVRPLWFCVGILVIVDVLSWICCISPIVGKLGEIIQREMHASLLRKSLLEVSVMYVIDEFPTSYHLQSCLRSAARVRPGS